jgi:integrase
MAGSGAPATLSKRNTAWNHYVNFLKIMKNKGDPICPTQLTVCLFIIYLFRRKLTYGTVRSYLFSLTSEIKIRGGRDILQPFDSWFIRSTLKHYQLKLGNAPIHYRRPLTIDIVKKLLDATDLTVFNNRVYITMIVVGVYGLFRIGELCGAGDKGTHIGIKNKDVTCRGKVAIIMLYGTKTDLNKVGVTKYFSDTGKVTPNPFRLIYMLKSLKKASAKKDDPFFTLKDGKTVSRVMLVKWMKQKLLGCFPKSKATE